MSRPSLRGPLLAACALSLLSCGRDIPTTPGLPEATVAVDRVTGVRLSLVSGGNQTGTAGQPLPEPVVVRVLDARRRPVADALVNFIASRGASADPVQARTDAGGFARTTWTLGPHPGEHLLRVAGTGGTIRVRATAVPGDGRVMLMKRSGDRQEAPAGTTLPDRLMVRAVRDDGTPVAGAMVHWTVLTGGGSLSHGRTRTSANGVTGVRWTLGPEVGGQSVSASLDGSTVTFTATATAPPPPVPPLTVPLIQKRVAMGAYGHVDLTQQPAMLNFWIHLAGRGEVKALRVRSPRGRTVDCTGMDAENYFYNEFRCQISLDRGDHHGLWVVDEVSLSLAGIPYVHDHAQLAAMGTAGRSFDVFSSGPDADPPQVRVVWPHGRSSSQPQNYFVQIGVVDHISGVRRVSATFRGPAGETRGCTMQDQWGALPRWGDWYCPLPLPASSGRWSMESVTVEDAAGNQATYTPEQIDAAVRGVFELTFLQFEYDL